MKIENSNGILFLHMRSFFTLSIFLTSVICLSARASTPEMFKVSPDKVHDIVNAKMSDLSTKEFRYNMNRSFTVRDGKSYISNVYSADSLIAAKEEVIYDGGNPVYFLQDRLIQDIKCELKIDGKKLNFTRYEGGKVVDTDSETLEDLTLVPDQIVPFIQQNWDKVMKGDSLKFRLTVPCRLETVGFKVFLDEEVNLNGKSVFLLKLKPKSFIIAAIVPSILLYFDKNSPHNIIEYRGHVLPVRKVGNTVDNFDGLIEFKEIISNPAK